MWVIVRVIGVFFLWCAMEKCGMLIGLHYTSSWAGVRVGKEMLAVATNPVIFALVVYTLLAFYFLRWGRFFFLVLSRMGGEAAVPGERRADPSGFELWLSEDESRRDLPYEKQLAMYDSWRLDNF